MASLFGAISLMVPKEQYGRANGMMSLSRRGRVISLLARALIAHRRRHPVDRRGDFSFAIFTLLLIFVPQPQVAESKQAQGGMLKQAAYGFGTSSSGPTCSPCNWCSWSATFAGMAGTLVAPMILSRQATMN
jgi:hypothetical protein